MTNEEWLQKYYPTLATKCKEEDAVMHSLLKWQGILFWMKSGKKAEDLPIKVDSESCALCSWYLKSNLNNSCKHCPLQEHLGHACDDADMADDEVPWYVWQFEQDPEPMIEALTAIAKKLHKI